MVLEHPLSKRLSLYGMNGGTCRVLQKEAQTNAWFVRKLSWSQNCNIFGVLKRKGTYRKWRSKVNTTQRRLHFQHAGHMCEVFDWEYWDLLLWNFMSTIWLVVTVPFMYVWSIYLLHFVYFVVNVATYTIHGCYGYVPYQYLCFHPQQSVTSPQVKVSDEELDRYELEAIEHESVQDALLPSLKLTWHLKMDGWNTSFLLGWPIFRGYVSFRECTRWDLDGVSGLLHVRYRFRSIFPIFFEGVYCLPGIGSKTVEKVAIKSQICRVRQGFSYLCSPSKNGTISDLYTVFSDGLQNECVLQMWGLPYS